RTFHRRSVDSPPATPPTATRERGGDAPVAGLSEAFASAHLRRRATQQSSGIDDDFTCRTAEQDLQSIQNVPPQDPFAADKVRLQSAGIILPVKPRPDSKCERCRGTACNTTEQALHA